MQVRTRFAPSPTGSLHVGSVRTALFSWLFARHHQGEFFLRIEDTDHERSTPESVQAILDGMAWLGLDHDADVIYQTDRYDRYMTIIAQLLETGHAYRCQCSKELLETKREAQLAAKEKPRYDGHCRDKHLTADGTPYVVRFKNPTDGVVSFHDEVYGDISVHNQELDDLVLLRTDGHPTYNFAVVVDDWDMQITHVIRGDDHINNTPRQINLFNALGAPCPIYAHLPMILGEDGKRLSKRHGAVNVLDFQEQGILPHALLNYLVRLGWSHGDQEIFSRQEMIALFNLRHVSRGVSSFNYSKLTWLNQHYQKTDAPVDVAQVLAWHCARAGIDTTSGPALVDVVRVQADRCKNMVDMCEKSSYFYQDNIHIDEEEVKKYYSSTLKESFLSLHCRFKALQDWQASALHQCIKDVCEEFSLGFGKIAQPLRVAMTGSSSSPSMDITLQLIGKERVLKRLEDMLVCLVP